ncbi:hypothetical protein CkP1_0074 [Citrobacter phage CkP1]|nr:hypothetical protein CkP1_0074 [Citrobacter phage CkP1]
MIREPMIIQVSSDELERLQRIEEILWEIESSLPSGLESWVDDDELQKLRGE